MSRTGNQTIEGGRVCGKLRAANDGKATEQYQLKSIFSHEMENFSLGLSLILLGIIEIDK